MIETLNGMTLAECMAQTKEERLAEVGTEAPCPFCQRPRVTRSTYIRCNPCGMNWFKDQDISRHPHAKSQAIGSSLPVMGSTAQPAGAKHTNVPYDPDFDPRGR